MNFYGLPGFIAYSILLGIACALIRQGGGRGLKFWLAGWLLILLHAGIFMLLPQRFPFDVVARGTLVISGQLFILAAYYQSPSAVRGRRFLLRVSLSAAVNLIFILGSAAFVEVGTADRHVASFYVLTALGLISTIWLAAIDTPSSRAHAHMTMGLVFLVYALQAWLLHAYGVTMASQWLMCWIYFAIAYFFLLQAPKLTMGIAFTALSFVLWGAVFPIYSLLIAHAPDIAAHIEDETWNLPKFLAAASMILVLLEEKVGHAVHLAGHDELTGLPNRRLHVDRSQKMFEKAKRDNTKFGLFVIDLNRFKFVNDTFGHQSGDELLIAVSERFRAALRHSDTVARTGGDEFTVILDGLQDLAGAQKVAEALRDSLRKPVVLQGRPHQASASIGCAIYPDDGDSLIQLQAVADERMYAAKMQDNGILKRGASDLVA